MAIETHATGDGKFFHTTSDFVDCPNCGGIIPMIEHSEGGITACSCGWLAEKGDPDSPDARTEEIVERFIQHDKLVDQAKDMREVLQKIAALPLETDELESAQNEYEARSGADAEETLCRLIRICRETLKEQEEG